MPLPELLALHVDDTADIDRAALKSALGRALEPIPTTDLIRHWREAGIRSNVDFAYPSLEEQINENSIIVHGTVAKVEFSREDLIDQILARQNGAIRVEITLNVLKHYPEVLQSDELTYTTNVTWEYLSFVGVDEEVVVALTRDQDKLVGGDVTCVYFVVDGLVDHAAGEAKLPLAEMWVLISGLYENVKRELGSGSKDIAEWLEMLKSNSLDQSLAAMHYLDRQPDARLDSRLIADAIEQHYQQIRPNIENLNSFAQDMTTATLIEKFDSLALSGMSILSRMGEPEGVERVYTLYLEDVSKNVLPLLAPSDVDVSIITLVASVPGPDRAERLRHLFTAPSATSGARGPLNPKLVKNKSYAIRALETVKGQDIDALLMEMFENPDAFHLKDFEHGTAYSTLLARKKAADGSSPR
jgi:hypothetical protein